MRKALMLTAALPLVSASFPAFAAEDIESLAREVRQMKAAYEQKVSTLENRIKQLEAEQKVTSQQVASLPPVTRNAAATGDANAKSNAFNPAIGVVLNGTLGSYSEKENSIAGFQVGEEGERGDNGFSLGESEVHISANVDDRFSGTVTAAIVSEEGEDKIELEEAFVQSLGLPYGASVKAGRMLGSLGYLNEKHAHTDDFVNRPLPYRVLLNNAFNDDGAQLAFVLPTDLYSELGGGAWRGRDFPGADDSSSKPRAYTAFARVGGDIGENQDWRFGASWLYTKANDEEGRITGEPGEELIFKGDDKIYILDAKYNWAPTGNATQQQVSLQGEYFFRDESGTYADNSAGISDTPYNEGQSGWYGQAVYKFLPQWRAGYRYTALYNGDVPSGLAGSALDNGGHDPYIHSIMGDYTHSEFSRIRLQYNNDHVGEETDNQFLVQYIMSLGAHNSHKY